MEGADAREHKATAGPATLKEAAKKRITDCINFLASPLKRKKGKECEYHHSDGARVNPRDCWYWLNGNCLNRKCTFRHPPLDGLIGIPGGSSLPGPPSQTVLTRQILVRHSSTSQNPTKQSASCYFFQKGQCLKGDKCTFMHGPESNEPELTDIPVPHQVIMISPTVAETPKTIKKVPWGLRPCARGEIPGATNEKLVGSLPLSDKHFQNDKGADESLGGSPSGLEEGEILRDSLQDGRTLYPYSDVATDHEKLMLKRKDDYLSSGLEDKHYGRKQQRTSSMRYKDEQVMSGKGVRCRVECPNELDRSDLRYRLLKQRSLHGPRPVLLPDGRGVPTWRNDGGQASCRKDRCLESEKLCGHRSSKDQRNLDPKSLSTRLQGRIKFPASNSQKLKYPQSKGQQDRERHIDRLKRKLPDDFAAGARSLGRHPVKRLASDRFNFAGPKSLAELKGAKVLDTLQEQSNKSINSRLSFERTSPIPPNDMVNLESMGPPTGLCNNDNEIDNALGKKGLASEDGLDGQSTVKDLVQMERDVTNAAEDRVNAEPNEESGEVYEDDVEKIKEEETENQERSEETGKVYEDDVQWTGNEERETLNDLKAEEDAYEDSAAEFSDDDDDFARKVALLLGM